MNPIGSAGSLANQKYEINKHIQRHLQVVSKTPPSHETTRWRGGTPAKPIGSSFTRGKSAVYEMHTRNEALSNRLYTIMHENREARSYEYAPGWRAGLDGAVIDCYPSHPHTATKNRFEHNSEQMRLLNNRKIEEENKNILKYLDAQKSSYPLKKIEKDYAETRRLFRIFQNRTSPSEMHLGLVAKAKKDTETKQRKYDAMMAKFKARVDEAYRRPSTAPALRSAPGSPVTGVERLVDHEGPSLELQHSPARPHTSSPKRGGTTPTSKTAQRLHFAVDRIDSVGDFIDVQVAAVTNELRASNEGGWNSSTHDNPQNNRAHDRPRSAYNTHREFTPAFQKIVEQTEKSKTRAKSAAGVLPSTQTATTRRYVEVSAPPDQKKEFTIYDAKERIIVSPNYPIGSFGKNGDLIDFQALAVEQAMKHGHSATRSSSFSPSKPKEVFPGVENGPDWVHFPASETLTRTYTDESGLKSPQRSAGRQPGTKHLPAVKKAVSFGEGHGHHHTADFQGVGAVPRKNQAATGVKLGKVSHEMAHETGKVAVPGAHARSGSPITALHSAQDHVHAMFPHAHAPHAKPPHIHPSGNRSRGPSPLSSSHEISPLASGAGTPQHPAHGVPHNGPVHHVGFGDLQLTDAEIRAMEALDDVDDGMEASLKSAEVGSQSTSSSVATEDSCVKGLIFKSHSGVETRSSNIFHGIEMNPRLTGYAIEDDPTFDTSGMDIPEIYEISVYDVGYMLPCSNNTLQFSTAKSKENAEIIPSASKSKMKLVSGRKLSTVELFTQLDDEDVDPTLFCKAVVDLSKETSSKKIFANKPAQMLSSKSQAPGDKLSIAQHIRNQDATDLCTTYGILIEAKALPPPAIKTSELNRHATFGESAKSNADTLASDNFGESGKVSAMKGSSRKRSSKEADSEKATTSEKGFSGKLSGDEGDDAGDGEYLSEKVSSRQRRSGKRSSRSLKDGDSERATTSEKGFSGKLSGDEDDEDGEGEYPSEKISTKQRRSGKRSSKKNFSSKSRSSGREGSSSKNVSYRGGRSGKSSLGFSGKISEGQGDFDDVSDDISNPSDRDNDSFGMRREEVPHTPKTYAYLLLTLREFYDLALKTNNDKMSSICGEMIASSYRFGEANNSMADNLELRMRREHQAQLENLAGAEDCVFFNDTAEVSIAPCLQTMMDRQAKRALTQLIKQHVELTFNTDEEKVSVGLKI